MGIIFISAIFFAVLFNVIILDDDSAAQHMRATLAGLIVGAAIGYFINLKFKNRLRN